MELFLDFFMNWALDKIFDCFFSSVTYFVFKCNLKQNEYPDHFHDKRRFRL
ncbi:hypothetical protein BLL41_18245 [Bacillus sp. FMQ74]|nr:hypothetical protein BLL41_18245 [Bacillus sp. FMQ74]